MLVVEDDKRLGQTLRDILEAQNYMVDLVQDGQTALDSGLSGIYDAMILDVMLPNMEGTEVCRRLRQQGASIPVLMVTARTSLADRVDGLDCGADYYLTKPFHTQELLACLRAVLRRNTEVQPQQLTRGDLTLDTVGCELQCGDGSLRLTAREFELIRMLMAASPGVVQKETLLLKLWGYESEAEDNHVEVYVSFLRKKLRHLGSRMEIRALRRVGYVLEEKP